MKNIVVAAHKDPTVYSPATYVNPRLKSPLIGSRKIETL
jgi:hypothetical protein